MQANRREKKKKGEEEEGEEREGVGGEREKISPDIQKLKHYTVNWYKTEKMKTLAQLLSTHRIINVSSVYPLLFVLMFGD